LEAQPQEGAESQATAEVQVASQAWVAQQEDDLQQWLRFAQQLPTLPHGFSQQLAAGAAQPQPLFIPSNVSRSSNPKLWVLRLTLMTSAPRIMCHFIEQPLLFTGTIRRVVCFHTPTLHGTITLRRQTGLNAFASDVRVAVGFRLLKVYLAVPECGKAGASAVRTDCVVRSGRANPWLDLSDPGSDGVGCR
jgi:hypothetical protein